MTDGAGTKTVVVERDLPFPPDRVWRALTQPHLMAEWLMQSDFVPEVDRKFRFTPAWGEIDCRVLAIESGARLSYTWDARGLESVVTWTVTASSRGTHLRMEQSGFRLDQPQAYGGARMGWQRFLDSLDQVLARLEQGKEG